MSLSNPTILVGAQHSTTRTVFLGLEDRDSGFPAYPVAKTGDWGLATKIKSDDLRNPIGLRGAGTEAYYAPVSIVQINFGESLISSKEQRIPNSRDGLEAAKMHLDRTALLPKLSAHTNIWGIGAIMFELLTHEAVAYYLNDEEWTVDGVLTDIPNAHNPKYSSALTGLIKLCLMPEPCDRPSIDELELKIGARCQSIIDEYAANPSLHEQDRLYYKGSEITQMPPRNWNCWKPVMEDVPRPSAAPDSWEPKNPFTTIIKYPPFPKSELDSSDGEGGKVQDDNEDENDDEDDNETPKSPKGAGNKDPIIISDVPSSRSKGNKAENPIVISDSDEDRSGERGERNESNEGDKNDDREKSSRANENDESHGSNRSDGEESWEGGSDNSDDSDVRRRMAIKTVPGT